MGFLDSTTSTIILDAVLTIKGRELIARGDGTFRISKFAIADDEVDYTNIQKYGRTVGIEKIEKNTPVFEALANGSYAQKYKCVSISNPNLIRLPTLSLTGTGLDSTTDVLSIGNVTTRTRTLSVEQTIREETSIDTQLRDLTFLVNLDSRFLNIQGRTPDNIDGLRRATYLLNKDAGENSVGGSRLTFTLGVQSIPESNFTIYGSRENKNIIKTYVVISGTASGATKQFEVRISKTS
jgi:hypothetical protein